MSHHQYPLLMLFAIVISLPVMGQSRNRELPRRARPPTLSPDDLQGVFFEDAFAHLRGTRPQRLDAKLAPSNAAQGPNRSTNPADAKSTAVWSTMVDESVIEDEVKRIGARLATSVASPGHFKSGGYRDTRQQLSELALLFAVIAHYDGDIRWERSAPAAANRFAEAARQTRVGTERSLAIAKEAREALQELLRGGDITASRPNEKTSWGDWVDRAPLMTRLERALDDTIASATANEGEFKKQQEHLHHESQLVQLIAHVLSNDQMPDGSDEEYVAYCQQMKDAARAVVRAVEQHEYEAARESAGKIQRACSDCHEDYR